MSKATTPSGVKLWVACDEILQEAVQYLRARKTHPHFIGYLHLRKLYGEQRADDTRNGILHATIAATRFKANWGKLKQYLEVDGGPPGRPHLRPFWDKNRSGGPDDWSSDWMGPNLAGSFAPSSIRNQATAVFNYVVGVVATGQNRRYFLQNNHTAEAFERLLLKNRMDAVYLSLFLHRNFGYLSNKPQGPTPNDITDCFRSDFHYDKPSDNQEFKTLYVVRRHNTSDWFNLCEGNDSP